MHFLHENNSLLNIVYEINVVTREIGELLLRRNTPLEPLGWRYSIEQTFERYGTY